MNLGFNSTQTIGESAGIVKTRMFGNREGQHISLKGLLPNFTLAIGDATKDEGEAVAYTNKIMPH